MDNPVALYQEIVGSWRPGRLLGADSEALAGAGWPAGSLGDCLEQILRPWQELAGQGARGVFVLTHGPISRDCFHRILEARLLGADSEVLAGAGWPEC